MKDDSLHHWLDRFLDYLLHVRRLSPRTLESYARDLNQIIPWLSDHGVVNWQGINQHLIRNYIAYRHRQGLAPKSLHRELSSLRSLYDFLLREEEVKVNPARGVRAPKIRRKLPTTLDVDQINLLLDIQDDSPEALRDLAIMELFYSSGLRLAELISLNLGDIDPQDAMVEVTGKGAKTRRVPVGSKAREALQNWLSVRNQMAHSEEMALFVGVRGKRISRSTVQKRLHHWSIEQHAPRNISPASCRTQRN